MQIVTMRVTFPSTAIGIEQAKRAIRRGHVLCAHHE
jgi:hypothetical protein